MSQTRGTTDTYRVALVGSGGMAECHTLALDALRHYYPDSPRIVRSVVASPSPERRKEFARRNGFETDNILKI